MSEKKVKEKGLFLRVPEWVHRALAAEANREKRTIGSQVEFILEERYKDAKNAA